MLNIRRKISPPVESPKNVSIDSVVQRLKDHDRPADAGRLTEAFEYAKDLHVGQKRQSGEPYHIHPLHVAWILANLGFDETCCIVGLLHDVVEDTSSTKEEVGKLFGAEIGELVDGVTKIGRHEYVRKDQAQAETFRKLVLASALDLRVILVKLADRLHNMQTLGFMPQEKRRPKALETLEIYAPIAHRLGMSKVKGDLEDLSFFFLYPRQYNELHQKVQEKMKGGRDLMEKISKLLREELAEAGISAKIFYRQKRYFSVYQKLKRQGIDISRLYDFFAFRIITDNLRETYAALGVVHQNWRPIPGRFKDYIAMPKPNLYQSLHTTVLSGLGQPFEVQIRTKDMDRIAEEGIAAHWAYKEGDKKAAKQDAGILWLRQLIEWQKEVKDPRTFLNNLKLELYPDEVYVFSPRGDVFSFPRGATSLDFAYRVHTDIGHHISGALLNGKLVPFQTELKNGDIVEILTHPNRHPSRDWLKLVVTPRAKSKIRHWLNTKQKTRATEIGRKMFEKELRKLRKKPKKVYDLPEFSKLLTDEGLGNPEDLFSRVGFGKASVHQYLKRIFVEEKIDEMPQRGPIQAVVDRIVGGEGPIVVRGQRDLMTYLAKCCNPLPGEPINGYVTRGRGVSVHSTDCPNVRNLLYNPERQIDVEWSIDEIGLFPIDLVLETDDNRGMLAKVSEAIAKCEGDIRDCRVHMKGTPGRARIDLLVEVKNSRHLEKIRRVVNNLPGVHRVIRSREGGAASGPP